MNHIHTILLEEAPRLRRFALSLTGAKAEADDLVQNVIMRLLEKGLPADVDPVPWMLRVCKNLWIDDRRAHQVRYRYAEQAPDEQSLVTHANEAGLQRDTEAVLQALSELPDKLRIALSLVVVEGLSYAEASEVMEVPIGTIMSRVARARSKLVAQFQGNILEGHYE